MSKPVSCEQKARDILERMGVKDAQSMSAGCVVELANLISEVDRLKHDKPEPITEGEVIALYGKTWREITKAINKHFGV